MFERHRYCWLIDRVRFSQGIERVKTLRVLSHNPAPVFGAAGTSAVISTLRSH